MGTERLPQGNSVIEGRSPVRGVNRGVCAARIMAAAACVGRAR